MKPCLLTSLLSLLASLPAHSANRTWDGGDASANMTAANNWNANTPVAAGDALTFPAGLAQADRAVAHNFPADTTWSGLSFLDRNYVLSGNRLRLTGGLTANFGGEMVISAPLQIIAAETVWDIVDPVAGILYDTLTCSAPVSATVPAARVRKTGSGRLIFQSALSVPRMQLEDGRLQIGGDASLTSFTVTGGALGGDGITGAVTLLGGSLHASTEGFDPAALAIHGDLHAEAGSSISVNFGSFVPGTMSHFSVHGAVSLNGAGLGPISIGNPPAVPAGTERVIIDNDGNDPISGTFSLRPEGFVYSAITDEEPRRWMFTYKGGDGNDFAIVSLQPTGVTRTWDGGGADNKWTTPGNWVNDIAPQPGDSLHFPAGAAQIQSYNDYPDGTVFNEITVSGIYAAISGNIILLTGDITSTASFPGLGTQFHCDLKLTRNTMVRVIGSSPMVCSGVIDTNGYQLTADTPQPANALGLRGITSGTGGFTKTGSGLLEMAAGFKYHTGDNHFTEGTVQVHRPHQFGGSNNTLVEPGCELQIAFDHEQSMEEPANMDIRGTLRVSGDPGIEFTGLVQTWGAGMTQLIAESACSFAGALSFEGPGMRKSGTATVTFSNTFTGGYNTASNLQVAEGEVILNMPVPDSWEPDIIVGDETLPAAASRLTLAAGHQLRDNVLNIWLRTPLSVMDMGAGQDKFTMLVSTGGTVTGTAAAQITVDELVTLPATQSTTIQTRLAGAGPAAEIVVANGIAASDLVLQRPLSGAAFTKLGPGRADIMADIPPGGLEELNVQEGEVMLFANCGSTTINLDGGLLGGNGTAGGIVSLSGGTVSPGASPGAIGATKTTWNSATILRMELNGTGPGTEYDQYFAYGPPDLGGATLQLTAGFDPAPGTEFMIVRNVSGEAITGTFANAPQNGFVSAPGAKIFQISYTGGDGDDVVLTRVEKGPPQIVQFQFTPAAVPGQDGNTHMVFQGVPGLTYDLEYSPDLQKWEVLKSEVAGIPAGQMIFDLAEPAAAARKFYRLTLP